MKTTRTHNRRNFLLAAGLGGAGVAAAVAGAGAGAKAASKGLPAADKATGYRATAHIEKYYKTTKV
jgi:hypothetical protein